MAFHSLVCIAWNFLPVTPMTVFVWLFLESTHSIYLIYCVYPAIPKNQEPPSCLQWWDMIPSAQDSLPTSPWQSSLSIFSFPAQALPLPWSLPGLFQFQFINMVLHCSLILSSCESWISHWITSPLKASALFYDSCECHLSFSTYLPASYSPKPSKTPSWAHRFKCFGDYCSLKQMDPFNCLVTRRHWIQ